MAKQFLLLVIGAVLISCNMVNTLFQSVQGQTPSVNTATYRNVQFNYELDYPAGWFVDETASPTTMFTSFKLGSLPDAEGVGSPDTKMDVMLDSSFQVMRFEDYLMKKVSALDCIGGDPVSFALVNGGQAVEFISISDMAGTFSIIYADLDGRYFQAVTFGNLTPARNIIRSLRAITPSDGTEQQDAVDVMALGRQVQQCYQP